MSDNKPIFCARCRVQEINGPLITYDGDLTKLEEKLRVAVKANEILSDVCKAYLQRVSYDWHTRFIEALDKAELNGGIE